MKIELYCTQSEFEKAKEAYAEGYFPCTGAHCPFGNDDDEAGCSFRCPMSWMTRENQLVYLEHHIRGKN